jgi:hypothetical protein
MTTSATRGTPPSGPRAQPEAAVRRLVESVRRFVAVHEQAAAPSALAAAPLTFAEGVERDLLAFRLERAARELREALRVMDAAAARSASGQRPRPCPGAP